MDSIDYYNKYAVKVFEDTVEYDMSGILEEFLAELEEGDTILDLGCGSGRDSLAMYDLGYDVTPLDGSEEMCKLAEIHTDMEVLQMRFEDMEFDEAFDGVWACGSLIHVPKDEIEDILIRIADALVEKGVFYMSVRKGDSEGFRGERYFSDYTESELKRTIEACGRFKIMKLWVTDDVRSSNPDTEWINVLARRR